MQFYKSLFSLLLSYSPKVGGAGAYPLPWKQGTQPMSKAYLDQKNPRVIFISSRVPAADVITDFKSILILTKKKDTKKRTSRIRGRGRDSKLLFCIHLMCDFTLRIIHFSEQLYFVKIWSATRCNSFNCGYC